MVDLSTKLFLFKHKTFVPTRNKAIEAMDASWRMRMGTSTTPPRRKSTESTSMPAVKGLPLFYPEDFSDVFGGPPQTLLSGKFSGEAVSPSFLSFYEEIFRLPEYDFRESKGGRSLSAFATNSRKSGFYDDIFGSDEDVRRSRERSRPNSMDKSKSNSSSILSSEELSPCRLVTGDDVALSSLASKIRRSSVPMKLDKQQWRQPHAPPFQRSRSSSSVEVETDRDNLRSSYYFGLLRRGSSPETTSLEQDLYPSVKKIEEASAVCQEAEQGPDDEDEEDEVMSSYVIEIINSDSREDRGEVTSIDEAIAWAKETNQRRSTIEEESDKNTCLESGLELTGNVV